MDEQSGMGGEKRAGVEENTTERRKVVFLQLPPFGFLSRDTLLNGIKMTRRRTEN